ncbi:MAG: aldehyde dehydrogenase [Pseudonocardia sp. SCN 72-86]|nr:MAG: aldehyde dehydrogenase [Pseudonocardia sp. SCN 72-86]
METAEAAPGIELITDRHDVLIGGRWVGSSGTDTFDVVDSWTERPVATVRAATVADVESAVAAARSAFDRGEWASRTYGERASVLDDIARRLESRMDEMVVCGMVEVGSPITISRRIQQGAVDLFRAVAAQARAFEPDGELVRADGGRSRIRREPTGVVAAIIPWNGPLATAAFKLAPALAAGCAVVLKSSPEAPLIPSILADVLADLTAERVLPEGLVSVLCAGREASEALVAHPEVDHVTFTGSTDVGRRIMAVASERIARVSLELGGKSAAVVLDDADLDVVAASLPMGGCGSSGQACIALTRILVSRRRHDELVEKLTAAFAALPMGDPSDPSVLLGPLAGGRHRARVESYIESAVQDGATVLVGGGRPAGLPHGYFVEATLLDNVRNDMRVAREEIFGPVVSIITYEDEDDAVAIANDSIYGLYGAVFTVDDEYGYEVAQRIRSGVVSVNAAIRDFTLPFGGYKQSGIGREGGRAGLEEFHEIKTVHFPVR